MKEFGLQLKKLRKNKGLNQDQLALALGVRKTTISNYETGYSTPPATTLNQIADFFGVTLDELCGKYAGSPALSMNSSLHAPVPDVSAIKIAVYSSLSPLSLAENQILYAFTVPKAFLGEGEFFALKISGNRMERASLTDGNIAIIRRQSVADEGDVVAISIGNEPAIFGRYYRTGDLITLIAESNNPNHHPMIINVTEQPVAIFGKVIKVIETVS